MLTLMNINMEGSRHFDLVINFILTKNPDCICFQEIPAAFLPRLQALGYHPQFAPMMYDVFTAPGDAVGVAIAAKTPLNTTIHYYAGSRGPAIGYNRTDKEGTTSFPVMLASVPHAGEKYHIATTHMAVTKDGHADEFQNAAVRNLLSVTQDFPAHLLCGDMNMPRGYNTNYERFLEHYIDTVPTTYTSSLDKSLHYAGQRTDLNAPIFDIYMVDYIFSQPPYVASDVTLHFGVSDHAAVTAHINRS